MGVLRSRTGGVMVVALLACGAAVGAVSVQVHRVTHPDRAEAQPLDVTRDLVPIEEVSFASSDGVPLHGWLVEGRPDRAPVVLCHDLGQSKGAMLDLAVHLHGAGFTVLTFDFRGHGASGGRGSSLGIEEKRDVIGAVDYLASRAGGAQREVGAYGAGMGAHALALAAVDRPSLHALVLDRLYPDVSWELKRLVFPGWGFAQRRLGALPSAVFAATHLSSRGEPAASEAVPRLVGRHLLLVAPAGDAALAVELERIYAGIPEQKDADGNLVTLPGSVRGELYGEDLSRSHRKVREFLEDRLAVR